MMLKSGSVMQPALEGVADREGGAAHVASGQGTTPLALPPEQREPQRRSERLPLQRHFFVSFFQENLYNFKFL
jgi:hypothetical protein